jgi:hypothetical protein
LRSAEKEPQGIRHPEDEGHWYEMTRKNCTTPRKNIGHWYESCGEKTSGIWNLDLRPERTSDTIIDGTSGVLHGRIEAEVWRVFRSAQANVNIVLMIAKWWGVLSCGSLR